MYFENLCYDYLCIADYRTGVVVINLLIEQQMSKVFNVDGSCQDLPASRTKSIN